MVLHHVFLLTSDRNEALEQPVNGKLPSPVCFEEGGFHGDKAACAAIIPGGVDVCVVGLELCADGPPA